VIVFTLLLFLIFPKLAFAQIKINSFCNNCDPEWIELINIGDTQIFLDNWSLKDENAVQNNKTGTTINDNFEINEIKKYDQLNFILNNDTDTIYLFDNLNNQIDKLLYPTPTPLPTDGPTETPIQPSPTETPLPVNTPEPTNTPILPPIINNIFINEFMPNPETGSEWVEIYNNNDFDLSLENWRVQDNTDKQRIISNNTIPSFSYFIFMFNNYLNNTGDSIRLLDQYNRQIGETYSYNSTKKGYSFSLQEDKTWCQTISSMNQDNFSCYSSPTSTPSPTDTPKPTSTPKNTPTPKKTPSPTSGSKRTKTVSLPNNKIKNLPQSTPFSSIITQSPSPTNISNSSSSTDIEPISMIFLSIGSLLLLAPLIIL